MITFHLSLQSNETLYSGLSRIAINMGYPTAGMALKELLGSQHKQLPSAFVSVIPQLSELTGIDRHTLIDRHTVLPLFRSFVSEDVYQMAQAELVNGRTTLLDKLLSTSANRMKLSGQMRYCPQCYTEQQDTHGYPYWCIEHQLSGVYICQKHQQPLFAVNVDRKRLVLPGNGEPNPAGYSEVLMNLAEFTEDAWRMPLSNYSGQRLRQCVRMKLNKEGFVTDCGRIRQQKWQSDFLNNWLPAEAITEIAALLHDNTNLYLKAFFHRENNTLSPLKHLLVLAGLFDSWKNFKVFYQQFDNHQTKMPKQVLTCNSTAKSIRYLPNEHGSLRSFARRLNCSVTTAKKIALQQGVLIERRPQTLFGAERDLITQLLSDGQSTAKIALKMLCSIAAVEQILAQNPDIVQQRRERRVSVTRQKHRDAIQKLLISKSTWRRTDVQKAARASYTWLYKNDSEWLYQQLPAETPREQRWLH
ncbi:TnsD family transposase [Rheinheimera muenzenbergensis]|uniref:TnsD family transposase n=1 Tax=Rheinheimera muenzenbergensis TaxID=1193628 RepID=A0ABU8C1K6_9GAMM